MSPSTKSDKKLQAEQRRARLAQELRSNLHKRKEQARSRALREGPGEPLEGSGSGSAEAATKPTAERLAGRGEEVA